MDVAAQEITKLAKRILPDRPFHLSVSPTGRYPVPPGLWPNTSPLQYTTFVSDADRGILLARPYFDIQQEPPKPPSGAASSSGNPAGASGKGETKKPVTKMSFKDYQEQKNRKRLSGSPTDTPNRTKTETKNEVKAEVKAEVKTEKKPIKSEGAMASYVDRQHLPPKPDFSSDR